MFAVNSVGTQPPPSRRRALLIGINDYSATRLGRPRALPSPGRDWPNLSGAVNDVEILRDMLIRVHGFERRNIVMLLNQNATRGAILKAIQQHLLQPAEKGDVLFFYYAGHGSQVRNSLSKEPDRLDESLVPADSRLGVRDIRDKELRRYFNRILDRGARLTVILDACHSGSGARGWRSGVRYRRVRRDPRDAADGGNHGPRPEDRGALVIAAAQDYDTAWERRDEEGRMHGAFSWAWIRAMRDASPHESAQETFLRAQARLRAETPFQEPVLAGTAETRLNPFLGDGIDRRPDRTVIGVERVLSDGTVMLQGGWTNGLSVGSELRGVHDTSRLTITEVFGPGRSRARVDEGQASVRSGSLVELVGSNARPARAWQLLESPPEMRAPFGLAARDARIVLRAVTPMPANIPARYYYVIGIERDGGSALVFPRGGSVENRLPIGSATPEIEIQLPYGVDTMFLLATDEPLPNPWILERDSVRAPARTPGTWSIEKFAYRPTRRHHKVPAMVSEK